MSILDGNVATVVTVALVAGTRSGESFIVDDLTVD